MDAVNNRGAAVKKREDTHRAADANKLSRITAGNLGILDGRHGWDTSLGAIVISASWLPC